MSAMRKYPRTHHLEGSRLQPGDEDLDSVPFDSIANRYLVVEEKLDGANAGFSFDEQGQLRLQSRGHFLTGGERERHFNLFKQWAHTHAGSLYERLGPRYVVFGEWLYAKHTIFYDRLPHYFMEFDVLDLETDAFLSTDRRRQLLQGLPLISVPVLRTGPSTSLDTLTSLVGHSLYKSDAWRDTLQSECEARNFDLDRTWKQTDSSDLMEGLYIKVEENGQVVERLKYVRASFLTAVVDSGSHWLRRPILPNQLAEGVDLFGAGGDATS